MIELLVVLGIIALLLTIAVPRYFGSIEIAKENILRENLRTTRETIDQFYGDIGRYPDSLDELIDRHYLRTLPFDPITESATTWIVVPPADLEKGNVYNLRSGAPGSAKDGTQFAEW